MKKRAGMRLLHDHVERFNTGITLGDFGPMLEASTWAFPQTQIPPASTH
jgi:hypothetical protein